MGWEAMSFEHLPQSEQDRLRNQEIMLDMQIELSGTEPEATNVQIEVPESSRLKREAAAGVDLGEMVNRLESDVILGVSRVLQLLVVAPGQLATPTGWIAGRPNPSVQLRLRFFDYGPDNVEGSVSMPDPTRFRRDLAAGLSLAAVMEVAGSAMASGAATALRTEILGNRILDR